MGQLIFRTTAGIMLVSKGLLFLFASACCVTGRVSTQNNGHVDKDEVSRLEVVEHNIASDNSGCPNPVDIAPCTCDAFHLNCNDKFMSNERLAEIFKVEFPFKAFDKFSLYSNVTNIGNILNNGLTFKKMWINAPLITLDANFLINTRETLEQLFMKNLQFDHTDSLWGYISALKNLKTLSVEFTTGLTVLPTVVSDSITDFVLDLNQLGSRGHPNVPAGVFTHFPNARRISVGACNLVDGVFPKGSVALRAGKPLNFSLASNFFTHFDPDMFEFPSAPMTLNLDLSANDIEILNKTEFKTIIDKTSCTSSVDLGDIAWGNRIQCDCSLAWIFSTCEGAGGDGHSTYQDSFLGGCADGRKIATLNPKDFANCTHVF